MPRTPSSPSSPGFLTWLPERRRRNTGTGASGISSDSVYRETSASKNPFLCLICISPGGEEKRRITSPGR